MKILIEDIPENVWNNLTHFIDRDPITYDAEESYAEDIAKHFGNGKWANDDCSWDGYKDWFEISEEDYVLLLMKFS